MFLASHSNDSTNFSEPFFSAFGYGGVALHCGVVALRELYSYRKKDAPPSGPRSPGRHSASVVRNSLASRSARAVIPKTDILDKLACARMGAIRCLLGKTYV
jgi:hypothetical protein